MGMPQFFERLQQATRIYGQELPEFLRTHPVTTARIADARNRVETLNYRKKTKSQLEFYLIQAKLRLIADSSIENEKYFHALLEDKLSKSQLIATKYGYAMALLDNKKALQAKSIMLELLQQASNNLIFVTALARIAWETNAQGEAITILKKALALNPNNHILVLNLADYYLQRDEAKYALPFLRTHMRHHAETPYLYHLLSRAEGATGSLSAAHRARAEYFYLNGQTFAAIEQLKIAKDLRNINEYQRLKIETRLKQLEEIALQEKQI